jgi:hypothetical protein
VSPARAEPEIKLPLVPDSVIERLVLVTAPAASCAAASDAHLWLAVGHKKTYKDAHVSLFKLDAQGKPAAGAPVVIKLPSPAALARFPNYPLSLAFHPQLPLLYVWQDIESATQAPAVINEPGHQEFDHLVIYNVAGAQPVQVRSQARGADFPHGLLAGAVAVDAANARLYLPNVHQPGMKPEMMYGTTAYLELGADGLPLLADPAKPAPPPGAGAASALKYMSPKDSHTNMGLPHGMGFVPVSKDAVILGVGIGAMTWDASNRRGWANGVMLHPPYGASYNDRIAGHPALPVIYTAVMNHNWVCAMEHVDGYLTLVPQRLGVEGAALRSYPVVLRARGELAVGGVSRLYLIALDAKGFLKPTSKQTKINSDSVEAVAYSDKLDVLYVAEEKAK